MVEYLSGERIQCTSLEKTNDSGNATLNGTSTNIATAINGVGSIDFDGTSSDYIEFSQALTDELNTATGSGAWTFSCWVYVESTSTDQHTILSKIVAGYASPSHELNFRQAGSNWQLHFGTTFSGTNTQAIGHTGWTHLILSATNLGTTAVVWKLYVDNQASPMTVTGTEAMLWNATTLLLFGRQNTSSSSERWFNGQAQEIAFWNKELDSSERSALFNSYAYGTATSGSNTGAKANTVATSSNLAYYTLNSSSVTNSSPNPSLGSNHPVNTRLEITDTRKIYRKVDPTTITYESDFADNSTGWNFQATSDITSNRLKVWNTTSPPFGQATYTLSSNVDGDFVLRYRLKWHAGDSYIFVGLYDELPSTLTDTTMDFCESGFYFTNNSNRGLRAYAGVNTSYGVDPIASTGASQTGVADTDYYIELIRDVSASTLKLNKYTSSDYTGTPETHTMSSTPSGITGLKYLKVVYSHDGSTGGTSSYFFADQIKLYAGVTSIDTDEWKERNTV